MQMYWGDAIGEQQRTIDLYADWTPAVREFRAAAARVRIVGSGRAVSELTKLEDFRAQNVLAAPPFTLPTAENPTEGWASTRSTALDGSRTSP